MKRYLVILKPYKWSLLATPILVFIFAICESLQPMLMATIIDDGVMKKDLSMVYSTGGYMILISLVGLAASICNILISSKTSIGFGTDLRSELFQKIQQLSFSDIDKFSSGSLITRLTSDISRIQQLILMSMRLLLRAPFMLFLSVFFVFKINSELALVLIAAIPILATSVFLILRKGFPFFIMIQQKIDLLNEVVRENLINIRVIKSFTREKYESDKFKDRSEDLRDMVIKASNIIVTIFPVMQLILNISIVAILWFGGQMISTGTLKVGELISFINYLTQVLMALMLISMMSMAFARASASSKRIVEVLETEPSLVNTDEGLENKHTINQGIVTFENVCFKHKSGKNFVLKDISFHTQKAETIAIVGATGSSKTTMVQLIPRLYDTTDGKVLIDGVDIRKYNLSEIHSKVSMVLQNNELFTGSIIDNLRWGKPDATMDDIIRATSIAQAHEFISEFTDGYNTTLGRGGINLSGGQKQRICIARALLRKPKILILDDSTSAVDTNTELKIRNGLKDALSETTVFIITQRINTMQSADRVIVLESGKIDAIGTPSELMEKSKIYNEIYNSQLIAF